MIILPIPGSGCDNPAADAAAAAALPSDSLLLLLLLTGNGSSITAVKNGLSVDTSMGLTPLEG